MGAVPKIITNHALVRYFERVESVNVDSIRAKLQPQVEWLDRCIQRALSIDEAELFVDLKRKILDEKILRHLSRHGVDIRATKIEILKILSSLPEWALCAINTFHTVKIINRNTVYYFEKKILITMFIKIGKQKLSRKS